MQKPSQKIGEMKLFPNAIQKPIVSAESIVLKAEATGVVLAVSFFGNARPTQP
jgi:hypothetical protein